jgi:DNA-binding YbaB/EbfC family protein
MFENFGSVIKMAKEMQGRVQEMQQNLQHVRVWGDAGAGMVRIEMNGKHEVVRVEIRDEAMEDREMLEGLVIAAANDAVRRINEEIKSKVGELGFNMPDLSGLV